MSEHDCIPKNISRHRLHRVWRDIKNRCTNPKYKYYARYGGRGITICDEWINDARCFMEWALDNGWKRGLEIDRIDNDLGYSPDNCRFVTHAENMKNQQAIRKNNTSGYRGVSKSGKWWVTLIRTKGKTKRIGGFSTAEEAAMAREDYVIKNNLGLPLNF